MSDLNSNIAVDEFESPCGCGGCEKWADCYYCYTCLASNTVLAVDVEIDAYNRWADENSLSYGEWLATRD